VGTALLPFALVAAGEAAPKAGTDTMTAGGAANGSATYESLLAWGQELYALNCAVCHGKTGGGLVEAKLAFPADHRNCTRCHRPNNRVVQPLSQPFEDNNMFSIGEPPALHSLPGAVDGLAAGGLANGGPAAGGLVAGGLVAVAQPAVILAYVTATMPRYDPGRLTRDEYVAITAHLLALNGRADEIAWLPSVSESND